MFGIGASISSGIMHAEAITAHQHVMNQAMRAQQQLSSTSYGQGIKISPDLVVEKAFDDIFIGQKPLPWVEDGNIINASGLNSIVDKLNAMSLTVDGNGHFKGTVTADKFIIKGEKSMIKSFKEYVAEHKQIIFTLGFVLLLDHLLLQGALKSKVQDVLNSILDRTKEALKPADKTADIKAVK
jgi:hypothetical protein